MSISQTYLDWIYQSNINHIQFEALLSDSNQSRGNIFWVWLVVYKLQVSIFAQVWWRPVNGNSWVHVNTNTFFFFECFQSLSLHIYIGLACFHFLHLYWTVHRMGTHEVAGQMGPQRWSVNSSQGLPFCRSCPRSIVVKDIAVRNKTAIWIFTFYEHAKSINAT